MPLPFSIKEALDHMGDNNRNNKPDSKSEWKLIDMVIPLFAFALAAYYFYTLRGLPSIAKYYGGTISVLIMLCFAGFVIIFFRHKLYLSIKKMKGVPRSREKLRTDPTVVAVELLVITLLYVGLVRLVGYTAATFVYLCVVMLFLGRRGVLRILLPAAVVTVLGYFLFVIILNLNISLDPVSKSLKYLIRGWIF